MQVCIISIANALEILQSCTKPSTHDPLDSEGNGRISVNVSTLEKWENGDLATKNLLYSIDPESCIWLVLVVFYCCLESINFTSNCSHIFKHYFIGTATIYDCPNAGEKKQKTMGKYIRIPWWPQEDAQTMLVKWSNKILGFQKYWCLRDVATGFKSCGISCFKSSSLLYSWWRHQMETFPALLALCAGNSPVPVNSPHKGQWRGALMFSLICVWLNGWINNREAGDLSRHRGHYDVSVMCIQ